MVRMQIPDHNLCVWGVTNECFVYIPIKCEHLCLLKELYHDKSQLQTHIAK